MGMLLSIPMIVAGVALMVWASRRKPADDPGRRDAARRQDRRADRADGPMTVADYMALCLGDPEHGYYMRREPFGRAGDFVTAPEVSQMFGELIGLWAVAAWQAMGAPRPSSSPSSGRAAAR